MKAQIFRSPPRKWKNRHENFETKLKSLLTIWPPSVDNTEIVAGLLAITKSIKSLIGESIRSSRSIRSLGGGWSLSRIAETKDYLLDAKPLNWIFDLSSGSFDSGFTGRKKDVYFALGGTHIGELHQFFRNKGRSLRTCGASNGQTIAGALSTGTHGSAIDVGAIPEYVVAIQLIAGPRKNLWLERREYPVVSQAFADLLETEIIRDTDLFNAALVGLGGFGVIQSVLVETEPAFLLEGYRSKEPMTEGLWQAIDTLDFSQAPLPLQERPFHFDLVFNPHETPLRARMTSMYKRPYREDYPRIRDDSGTGAGDDVFAVLGALTEIHPQIGPAVLNATFDTVYPTFPRGNGKPKTGTLGEIFSNTNTRGPTDSMAMGIPLGKVRQAMDCLTKLHQSDGPFPGIFALRYVKESSATLGFTHFGPHTAILELDGVQSRQTTDFYRKTWKALAKERIPFTLHWGKTNHYLTANRVRKMYGDRVDKWLRARQELLSAKERECFANPFLKKYGLHL